MPPTSAAHTTGIAAHTTGITAHTTGITAHTTDKGNANVN
jgi:hypothetical protein